MKPHTLRLAAFVAAIALVVRATGCAAQPAEQRRPEPDGDQLQNLLNQLGITNLSGGLTQLDLNRILAALGLGSTPPAG